MGVVELIKPPPQRIELTELLEGLEDAMRRLGYREPYRQAVAQRFEQAVKAAQAIGGRIPFSTWPEYLTLEESVIRAALPLLKRVAEVAAAEMRRAVLINVLVPELIELMGDSSEREPPSGGRAA